MRGDLPEAGTTSYVAESPDVRRSVRSDRRDTVRRRLLAGRFHAGRLVAGLALLVLLAVLVSACDVDVPQNTFDAKGQPARDQKDIFILAMWPAIVIGVAVLAALLMIVLRFRERREGDGPPKQLHGNTRLEIAWTLAPTLLLLGLAVPMVAAIFEVGRSPASDAFQVRVEGRQWAWFIEYPEILDASGNPVQDDVGQVHVPVGQEVSLTIVGGDVIHSFWVPKLAGKLDAIPGKENVMWIRVDEPGSYSGQCAEFCGLGHAEMKVTLTALSEDDFQKWEDEVTASAGQESGGG